MPSGRMQTVNTGQEPDPHNIWLYLAEIRSVCRPTSKSRGRNVHVHLLFYSAADSDLKSEVVDDSYNRVSLIELVPNAVEVYRFICLMSKRVVFAHPFNVFYGRKQSAPPRTLCIRAHQVKPVLSLLR